MSVFSEQAFVKKLNDMNNSQQSIQTLSLWLIHHRKNAKTIVQVWQTQLIQNKIKKKLIFLYLANDVIQNSRKKGQEFIKAFGGVLITAFTHVAKHADEKTLASVNRMLGIWKDRKIYESNYISNIKQAVVNIRNKAQNNVTASSSAGGQRKDKSSHHKRKREKSAATADTGAGGDSEKNLGDVTVKVEQSPNKKSRLEELIGQNEEDDYLSMIPGEVPQPQDLVKALNLLENSASSDANIRQKIAQLPEELQDVVQLDNITDRKYATNLFNTVIEAIEMLDKYNTRLQDELNNRRRVARMLADFTSHEKNKINELEITESSVNEQLKKYDQVSKELSSHIENLPDFSRLQTVNDGLPPLPSAGDLFN